MTFCTYACIICIALLAFALFDFKSEKHKQVFQVAGPKISLSMWFKAAPQFSEMHIKALDFLLHLGFALYLFSVEERRWFFSVLMISYFNEH